MVAGGGAPVYDVDHEVFARLNRFEVSQNLVINMVLGVDAAVRDRSEPTAVNGNPDTRRRCAYGASQ
jgi:hypothetical protein